MSAPVRRVARVRGGTPADGAVARPPAPAERPVPRPAPAGAADRVSSAARAIIADQVRLLEAHREGAADGRVAEHLHDLRVAARRLRLALHLFAPHLPRRVAGDLRTQLGALMLPMAEVRDLDVLLEALPGDLARIGADPSVGAQVTGPLREARAEAQRELAGTLRGTRVDELLRALHGLAAPVAGDPGGPGTDQRVAVAGARLLRRAGRRLLAREPGEAAGDPEALHRLRIAARRFRYTCEFFAAAFGRPANTARRAAVAVQDCLGAHQDAAVALERFQSAAVAACGGETREPGLLLALGALAQLQRERAAALRNELPRRWSKLRAAIRRLDRLLD